MGASASVHGDCHGLSCHCTFCNDCHFTKPNEAAALHESLKAVERFNPDDFPNELAEKYYDDSDDPKLAELWKEKGLDKWVHYFGYCLDHPKESMSTVSRMISRHGGRGQTLLS